NCIQAPEYITLSIPVVTNAAELRYLIPGEVNIDDASLTNTYSLVLLKVPISIKNDDKTEFPANRQVINRLKLINEEVSILKKSLEYQ
ncbi:hypothetical protein ILUMI_19608, partial [Ignelater luminosus]